MHLVVYDILVMPIDRSHRVIHRVRILVQASFCSAAVENSMA